MPVHAAVAAGVEPALIETTEERVVALAFVFPPPFLFGALACTSGSPPRRTSVSLTLAGRAAPALVAAARTTRAAVSEVIA